MMDVNKAKMTLREIRSKHKLSVFDVADLTNGVDVQTVGAMDMGIAIRGVYVDRILEGLTCSTGIAYTRENVIVFVLLGDYNDVPKKLPPLNILHPK